MLFQGQEFGASSPFFYFADQSELTEVIRKGRLDFLEQFPSLRDPEFKRIMPRPGDISTFNRSKLNWTERETNTKLVALHRDLLSIRKQTMPSNLRQD
jgi:maltooligosyltrehalose trehalohydrolase